MNHKLTLTILLLTFCFPIFSQNNIELELVNTKTDEVIWKKNVHGINTASEELVSYALDDDGDVSWYVEDIKTKKIVWGPLSKPPHRLLDRNTATYKLDGVEYFVDLKTMTQGEEVLEPIITLSDKSVNGRDKRYPKSMAALRKKFKFDSNETQTYVIKMGKSVEPVVIFEGHKYYLMGKHQEPRYLYDFETDEKVFDQKILGALYYLEEGRIGFWVGNDYYVYDPSDRSLKESFFIIKPQVFYKEGDMYDDDFRKPHRFERLIEVNSEQYLCHYCYRIKLGSYECADAIFSSQYEKMTDVSSTDSRFETHRIQAGLEIYKYFDEDGEIKILTNILTPYNIYPRIANLSY